MHPPPRLARWLLERALPRDVRDDVSGDLEELYRRHRARGALFARLWFWRQVFSFWMYFVADSLREQQRQVDMRTGISWIDFRLGVRMLVRYPGLTLVGVLGMAVGIAIAAAAFGIVYALLDPALPFEEGDRIVAIQNWDVASNNADERVLRDFAVWREELTSVQDVGAFRTVARNLIAERLTPETVPVAEMSAAGFALARVSPMLGRHLLPEDERADASPAVVIGYDAWRRRFREDPAIIGRPIQLGDTRHAVVGVMPEGFAFPINHEFWIPLRVDARSYQPRTGPAVSVFARLRPGATFASARAELETIGRRTAAAHPVTHEHLRPRLTPYTYPFTDMDDPTNAIALQVMQSLVAMLLGVIAVNVAILVYARTATRQGEIAVRSALGASRRRIVAQLFVEALVLAGVAAVVGIGLVAVALRQVEAALFQLGGTLPFWMSFRLSPGVVAYIVLLAVVAAIIVGVVPALKATGGRVQVGLQGLSAGSGARMQMGRMWTVLIVAQVAVAVGLLPATIYHSWNSMRFRTGNLGFAAAEFLTTELALDAGGVRPSSDAEQGELRRRYAARKAELLRQIETEPAVGDVTFAMANPGEEWALVLEIEGQPVPADPVDYNIVEGSKAGHLVRFNRVGVDFFEAYGVPLLTGRQLQTRDAGLEAEGIVVNRAFVERLFGTTNPLGRRVRYVGRSREARESEVALGRWYQVVGVVADFPAYAMRDDGSDARVYHAAGPGDVSPAVLAIKVRGADPMSFAQRLRQISASVDPNLQLRRISSVEEAIRREQGIMRLIAASLSALTLSVVVLSAAGIYALMSFTVARRRKEIGIRAALGADPSRILASIFSRAFRQLGLGAALGMAAAFGLEQAFGGDLLGGNSAILLPLVAVMMTAVGLLAALAPARRGLSIQPTEALREE